MRNVQQPAMRGASPEARDAPFAGEPNDLRLRVAWHDLARPEKPPSRRDVCDDGAVSTSLPRLGGPVVGGNGVPTVRATSFDLTPLGRQEKWEESSGGWPRTEGHFAVIQKDEPDEHA